MRRTDFPQMASCDGCKASGGKQDCCTIVRVRPQEAKAIRRFTKDNNIEWEVAEGIRCGFARDGNVCAIYDVRPFACRAMGVTKQMPCSHFPEEAVMDFPPEQAVSQRLSDPDDAFLGWYFEPGYYERMKKVLEPQGYTIGVS